MKKSSVLLTALLASLSIGAVAQTTTEDPAAGGNTGGAMGGEQGQTQTQTFTELDGNNDGVLDQDEVEEANVQGDFSDMDANGDDEVDRNEYYQYQRQQR